MDLETIQNRVARAVGDNDFTFIEAADITEWANEYLIEIANKIRFNLTTTAIDSVSGTERYALPATFLKTVNVTYDNIDIIPVAFNELSRFDILHGTTQGFPVVYYVLDNQIGLYPKPERSITGGIVVEHTVAPADLVNPADVPEIPLELHNYLVYYARAMAYYKLEEPDLASALEARCEQKLKAAIHDFGFAHHEVYPSVGAELHA